MPPAARAAKMLKTVRGVAATLARRLPSHVELDDLVGAGALGLADALSRRNDMPGREFEAFALCRIRGAMFDELRRLDTMPRRVRSQAKEIAKASRCVELREGGAASEEQVAAELGLGMSDYQAARATIEARRPPIPIASLGEDADDVMPAANEAPDAVVARGEVARLVAGGIDALPERLRKVVASLYAEGRTLKDIGVALGVSESRVCQMHSEAIRLLRTRVASAA